MSGLYPGAKYRPVSYHTASGDFSRKPLGWILHVVVGNGSPFHTFESAKRPHRRFSHFWVSKKGTVEQFAPITSKSWAQGDGNGSYISIETEGFPNEALTGQQIDALARLHNWLSAPNQLANRPGARGIGTHYMGGPSWGGHTCPDSEGWSGPRSKQRVDILDRAAELRRPPAKVNAKPKGDIAHVTPDPLSPADIRAIADAITGDNARYQVHEPNGSTELSGITEALAAMWQEIVDIKASITKSQEAPKQ